MLVPRRFSRHEHDWFTEERAAGADRRRIIVNTPQRNASPSPPSLWLCMVLTAMAGGMGWGIRGQYGHETGAMIAGVLVGLVLLLLFGRGTTSLTAARAAAMFALGISIGGCMTYGQTVGLTHNGSLVGNWEALRWGLTGLFLKGGIWIGFAGVFFGMALSGRRYRPLEVGLLLLVMVFLIFLGLHLFNMPFNPAEQRLPRIYFSEHWYWKTDAELQPRPEQWGGLLVALIGMVVYAGVARRDWLAVWLAFWGFLAGGAGFSLGQSVQAFHAWNTDWFRQGWFGTIEPYMNWWNMMEITFGAVFGAILALGVWLNRRSIHPPQGEDQIALPPGAEWLLLLVHLLAVAAWNFGQFYYLDVFANVALTMIIIPMMAVLAGRLWPYFVTLPVVAAPIAGKTFRALTSDIGSANDAITEQILTLGTPLAAYVVLPVMITVVAAVYFAREAAQPLSAGRYLRWALLVCSWLYFGLNFAFFNFPWPWGEWTGRTPSGIIFTVCLLGLTAAALLVGRKDKSSAATVGETPRTDEPLSPPAV